MGTATTIAPDFDTSHIYVYYNREDEACRPFQRLDTKTKNQLVSAAESGGTPFHRMTVDLAQRTRCAGLIFATTEEEAYRSLGGVMPALREIKSDHLRETLTPYALGLLIALGITCIVRGAFSETILKRAALLLPGAAGAGLGGFLLLLEAQS